MLLFLFACAESVDLGGDKPDEGTTPFSLYAGTWSRMDAIDAVSAG